MIPSRPTISRRSSSRRRSMRSPEGARPRRLLPKGPVTGPSPLASAASRGGGPSANGPGVAGGQELRDVPGTTLGHGALLLIGDEFLVDGRLDLGQDADRNRELGGGETREDEGRSDVGLVMHPEPVGGHLAG